jgi:hypothetical protein
MTTIVMMKRLGDDWIITEYKIELVDHMLPQAEGGRITQQEFNRNKEKQYNNFWR